MNEDNHSSVMSQIKISYMVSTQFQESMQATFRWIVKAKWQLIQLDRMERLLSGELLNAKLQDEWIRFPKEIQQFYEPLDAITEDYNQMLNNFIGDRLHAAIKMVERENELIAFMWKYKRFPPIPEWAYIVCKIKGAREILEEVLQRQLDIVSEFQRVRQVQLISHLPEKNV